MSTINSANDAGGNCFAGNQHATSIPADLEQVVPCTGRPTGPFRTDLGRFAALLGSSTPPAPDYRAVALPPVPALPNLPNARHAPARPAAHEPSPHVPLAAVSVPRPPTSG